MFRRFRPTSADLRGLIQLAIPMVVSQVGIMLMGVVDTVIVGRVSARELAAASLGNLYYYGVAMCGLGILWATDPLLSQALGAKDHEGAKLTFQRAMVIALGVSILGTLLCLPAEPLLRLLRQPPEVIPRAAGFVWISAFGMIPLVLWATLRLSLQCMKRTREIVITIIVGNVLNVLFNWMMVFGHLGFPPMGALGSALSSTVGRWIMLAMLLVLAREPLAPFLRPWRRASLERAPLLRTLRLGLPIGIHVSVEFSTFAIISVFAGWFGAEALAGHQVAINMASLMFMVPSGIGSAAAVMVGHAIGESDAHHARRVAASALVCGAGFMLLSAILLLGFPGPFARLYSSVPGIITVAVSLIPIAGLFQVFDGIQVVAAGVLRGAGETRAAMVSNLSGFWLVGTPVSLALGFGLKLGVVGLWWGFVAGLFAVAAIQLVWVHRRLGGEIVRTHVDASAGPATH